MARKGLLVAVLLTAFAAGAFARPQFGINAGGGIMFDYANLGYVRTRVSDPAQTAPVTSSISVEQVGFGAWGFLDATFAELSVGVMGGPVDWYRDGDEEATEHGSFAALDFSLLGRFPIAVAGGSVSVFPLLGIGYSVVLVSREEFAGDYPGTPSHLNSFRLQFGAGGDFNISERAFVRTSVLGTWRFAGRYLNDLARELRNEPNTEATTRGDVGVTVKVGVGLRL